MGALGQEGRCWGFGWGWRLREPLGTTEAEAERGSESLGMEPDILLTVTLGTHGQKLILRDVPGS